MLLVHYSNYYNKYTKARGKSLLEESKSLNQDPASTDEELSHSHHLITKEHRKTKYTLFCPIQ